MSRGGADGRGRGGVGGWREGGGWVDGGVSVRRGRGGGRARRAPQRGPRARRGKTRRGSRAARAAGRRARGWWAAYSGRSSVPDESVSTSENRLSEVSWWASSRRGLSLRWLARLYLCVSPSSKDTVTPATSSTATIVPDPCSSWYVREPFFSAADRASERCRSSASDAILPAHSTDAWLFCCTRVDDVFTSSASSRAPTISTAASTAAASRFPRSATRTSTSSASARPREVELGMIRVCRGGVSPAVRMLSSRSLGRGEVFPSSYIAARCRRLLEYGTPPHRASCARGVHGVAEGEADPLNRMHFSLAAGCTWRPLRRCSSALL